MAVQQPQTADGMGTGRVVSANGYLVLLGIVHSLPQSPPISFLFFLILLDFGLCTVHKYSAPALSFPALPLPKPVAQMGGVFPGAEMQVLCQKVSVPLLG